ncbi:MAG TPA: hypothetical protein VHE81_19165 [Lacipirellulaceae bacterium]|nr:hypothetical protein [Lacipirellulaceae bacterium]
MGVARTSSGNRGASQPIICTAFSKKRLEFEKHGLGTFSQKSQTALTLVEQAGVFAMRKTGLVTFLLATLTASTGAQADQYVHGYVRKDGTYVAPYYRTEPNSTRNDNYSTRGNVNPYTGQPGTKCGDECRDGGSPYSNSNLSPSSPAASTYSSPWAGGANSEQDQDDPN